MTVLDGELRSDRVPGDKAFEGDRDPGAGEVFLAQEELHPSLDEIFQQIDAAHRRTLELERVHPAHGRNGTR